MRCKFEIQILSTRRFHCARRDGPNGWAYTWYHDGLHDPCDGCKLFVAGKPTRVENELKPTEFWKISGGLITAQDWE